MRILLWLPLLVAACAKPAGGPLKHTFDNTRIAAVPLEAKQSVTEAQQRHDLAQLDRKNASTEHGDAEIEEDLAEYQAAHTIVVSQVVASRHSEARPVPDAALSRRVADAKVAFMRARRAWMRELSSWALYEVYATQAKLELERAKIAQANNAAPGIDLAAFENQAASRERAAQSAKDATETERKNAEAKLAAWSESEKELMRTAGIQGPVESARYTATWKSAAEQLPAPSGATAPGATDPGAPAPAPAPAPPAS
jgi:hypothetical protein